MEETLPLDPAAAVAAALDERGWRHAFAAAAHLGDLERVMLRVLPEVDAGIEESLARFRFELPEDYDARSMIVVAFPAPAHLVTFTLPDGRELETTIPPTYVGYSGNKQAVRQVVADVLAGFGLTASLASLPEKTVAAHLGLARYGRNNITYYRGLGSFAEPVVLFSDLEPPEDSWSDEAKTMDRCSTCSACLAACPTGAIGEDRFLLHASRCVTLYNESEGDFPDFIPASAHNSLIGCMICQRACPEDRGIVDVNVVDHGSFSSEETALFLASTPLEELPEATAEKLKALDILGDYEVWARNLAILAA